MKGATWRYLKKDILRRVEEGAGRIGKYPQLILCLALNASNPN